MKLGYFLSAILLCTALPATSFAMGSSKPKPSEPPKEETSTDALVKMGLNIGITYAKQNPKIARILSTLNINVADDITGFISGNQDGSNMRNILARLAYLELSKGSQYSDVLTRLGITSEADLRNFLSNSKGSVDYDFILRLALDQALGNSRYSVWLQFLDIRSIEDFKQLLTGGKEGNLLEQTLRIALFIVKAHPQYGQYVVYIELAMAALGISPGSGNGGDTGNDDDIINLGPFNGMTVGEARAVQSLK